MSFLYLEGYKRKDIDSFFTLYDILQLSKPNLVAVSLSEKEFKESYYPITINPKFDEMMQRAEFFAKIKSNDIMQIKGTV